MQALDDVRSLKEWQELARQSPFAAAKEFLRRTASFLSPGQRQAAFSWLPDEGTLTHAFAQARSHTGALSGVPYVLKDLFHATGTPLRAGSAFPPSHFGERDSALARLLRSHGCVLAGKTHLHEFAYGLTGENPHHGDCDHPRFPGRTSGGSSSGSAVAVGAGLVPFAIGTDTGGSIRVPSAFCGLFGYRHQPLNTWIDDAFPLAPSFDTAGWFTATAKDMKQMCDALLPHEAGADTALRGTYLLPKAWLDQASPEIISGYRNACSALAPLATSDLTTTFQEAFSDSTLHYAVLQSSEAFRVHQHTLDAHKDLYGPDVWGRIDRGRRWTEEQDSTARSAWRRARAFWEDYFRTHNFLLLPATPFPALTKADCTLENRNRLLDLTTPASLGGNPVLTVPYSIPSGLSGGVQVIVKDARSRVPSKLLAMDL